MKERIIFFNIVMEYLEIEKSIIDGMVFISGAKNVALPLIYASLLSKGVHIFENVPDILDIRISIQILNQLNVKTKYKDNILEIDTTEFKFKNITFELIKKLRASYYLLGVLIPQINNFTFTYPGGCSFQERPIDYHLDGLKKLGVKIYENDNVFTFDNSSLKENIITLPRPSVGATINLLFSMVQIKAKSEIINPSLDFEAKKVIDYLNKTGHLIEIEENKLIVYGGCSTPIRYVIPYDRVEVATFSLLGAASNRLLIFGIDDSSIDSLLEFFDMLNIKYDYSDNALFVEKSKISKEIKIKLSVDPYLNTDLGPLICAFLLQNNKISIIEDSIYPSRNEYVNELRKLGAKIEVVNNKIIIFPNSKFNESSMFGKDLRGTMSLVIASIISNKKQKVFGLEYLKRGYEDIINKLIKINVDIRRKEQ